MSTVILAVGGRRRGSRTAGWLASVAGWLLLLASLALLLGSVVVPRVAGATAYTILTTSMEPSYPPGTLVVTRPVAPADLAIGDAVTFQLEPGKPAVVTHRIVGIGYAARGGQTFRTQGDHNPTPDPEAVQAPQIRGAVWYAIPYLGYANTWLSGHTRGGLITLVAVALIGYAAWMLVSSVRDRRRLAIASRARQPGSS